MNHPGFNTGFIEELYRQYLENPDSVSATWREFFADFKPDAAFLAAAEARPVPTAVHPAAPPPAVVAPGTEGDGAPPPPVDRPQPPIPAGAEVRPIRGPAARIVENMEASLAVPTATSVRTVPVKLMAENRLLINDFQKDTGGDKVSFTHLVAWAIVRGLKAFPNMITTYRVEGTTPQHVIPDGVNLGLAIDVERKGKRTLLVPNVKHADRMRFVQFLGIYNDIVRRARENRLEVSDFEGTNASITNPGMIGTDLSVPRLMPGQGVIVGVGSIGYPTEYFAFPPEMIARTGISQVMTITSTYDHRVIQGAESGAFLQHVEELLLGRHGFYEEVFADLGIPYPPYVLQSDSTPSGVSGESGLEMIEKQAQVLQLIRAFRVRGHLQADVNPLGYDWSYHPELDPAKYGLTIWDLDRKFVTGDFGPHGLLPLREILEILRRTYTRKVGVEFMHISDPGEKEWIVSHIEPNAGAEGLSEAARRRMLEKLNAAEAFENFLHTKYIGHKRFSLEGAETMIPVLDMILTDAAERGVDEVVIGMAHRGRLNVLANILNKPYEVIFSEFEGNIDPTSYQGSGDVKYHLGAKGEHVSPDGRRVRLMMASNPSHLEAVNPVVEGMVRARQESLREQGLVAPDGDWHDTVVPILVHGDAAFAGQGVVAETLNLSQLPGYRVGGTIHLIVNNQIGFTTSPDEARSSQYATDVARMIQAPIFHVNGDDPDACVRVARLAFAYRQEFNKDVVIDLLCYRVRGHNEGDEPTYTQPLLYKRIEAKRSVRKLYTELLLRRGDVTPEEAETILEDFRGRLQEAFDRTRELSGEAAPAGSIPTRRPKPEGIPAVETRVSPEAVEPVLRALSTFPSDFAVHRKLLRQFERRTRTWHEDRRIDWGFAEALAFGTLLQEGKRVRISGQDSRRGTFSHRHAVVYDQETGAGYTPLNHIGDGQAHLWIYDSFLSEYAACGFEYGYSVAVDNALVIWEAQFGDFSNGAQIVYDQFLSAAEEKWGQTSNLVLLLPHGFEGQGPEHSSARLERFLQLCAENNMIVANLSTPANYFHALRRQVHGALRKPLVVMAPKSLLRHPDAVSAPEDFTEGSFREILPDATVDPAGVERLVFCSGKVYYEALHARNALPGRTGKVALTRIEQLYPFPADAVRAEIARMPASVEVVWMQEEPANMGAWSYVRQRLDDVLEDLRGDCRHRARYAGRPASASPASGSQHVHQAEQETLIAAAVV